MRTTNTTVKTADNEIIIIDKSVVKFFSTLDETIADDSHAVVISLLYM